MMDNQKKYKIYINIEGFDTVMLDRAVQKVISSLKEDGVKAGGVIFLPRKTTKFTLNRSPHVDKKSREQFEKRVYKRLIVLRNFSHSISQISADFSSLSEGVEINVEVK